MNTPLTPTIIAEIPCIRVSAPHWFERADFIAVLNEPGTATWHKKGTDEVGSWDWSDLFVYYNKGEGSNSPKPFDPEMRPADCIPHDLWQELEAMLQQENVTKALVWISAV